MVTVDMTAELTAAFEPVLAPVATALQPKIDKALADAKEEGYSAALSDHALDGDQALKDQIADQASQIAALNAKTADLEAKLANSVSQEDADAKATEAAVTAVTQLKADLKSRYDAQQVAETEGETGFASLLG